MDLVKPKILQFWLLTIYTLLIIGLVVFFVLLTVVKVPPNGNSFRISIVHVIAMVLVGFALLVFSVCVSISMIMFALMIFFLKDGLHSIRVIKAVKIQLLPITLLLIWSFVYFWYKKFFSFEFPHYEIRLKFEEIRILPLGILLLHSMLSREYYTINK